MTTHTPPDVVYEVTEYRELQAGNAQAYAVTELPRPAQARVPAVVPFICPCGIHCGAALPYFPILFQQS